MAPVTDPINQSKSFLGEIFFFFRTKSSLLSLTGELVIDWLVAAGNAESTLIYGIRKDRHVPNELLFLVNETEDLEKKKSLTSSN